MTIHDLKHKIEKFPRVSLIHSPTPFRKLENLTAELGGPEIYIKRDDLTGLAFGGNKSRKLEFIIPDMLAKKADTVVTWAALQSNWAMQMAAAAKRFGIQPVLILFKRYDLPEEYDGNMLLDYILGAEIHIKEPLQEAGTKSADYLAVAEEVAEGLRRKGHRPYVVAVGGSMPMGSMTLPLGAISYVDAFLEMAEQTRAAGFEPDFVVHSTGSGSTQAGLVVGSKAISSKTRIVGISVSDPKEPFARDVLTIAKATETALGLDSGVKSEDVIVFDEYIKDGYGIVNREVAEIIRLVFTREGIVLDPVYTSKAMAGLVDLVNKGYFKRGDKIVFFHTGGTPALFPNRRKIVEYLR
ncbi:MAG: D-cysteine desulfhydrase family protein [Candidatus Aminicenantes bacterium]|nr:D-cysteine desulfhydrase family protein [Candidatus Aminicenantes bacterium]